VVRIDGAVHAGQFDALVIYHASGYVGFPAAASARVLAAKILADQPSTEP
jgi:hypothetical protein